MKKIFWVKSLDANKEIVTTALESGVDAILTGKGKSEGIKKLGRITTIAEDGDLKIGKDVEIVKITSILY